MKYSLQEALRELNNPKKNLKESADTNKISDVFNKKTFVGSYSINIDNDEIFEYDEWLGDGYDSTTLTIFKDSLQKDLNSINNLPEPYKQFVIENIKNSNIDVTIWYDPIYNAVDNYDNHFDDKEELDDDGYGVDYYIDDDDNYHEIDHYDDREQDPSSYCNKPLIDLIKEFNLDFNFTNYEKPLKLNNKQYNEIVDNLSSKWIDAWNKTNK